MILVVFLLGAALGVGGAYAWYDAWRIHTMLQAERETAEWKKEVTELRAQVARHIGT